jgi:hypothetical protein
MMLGEMVQNPMTIRHISQRELSDKILSAMADFFDAWQTTPPFRDLRKPVDCIGNISAEGNGQIDGWFAAKELAIHVADALTGRPRKRFNKFLEQLTRELEFENTLTPFQKKWELDGRWLMGPGILANIVLFLKDESLIAVQNGGNPSAIDIVLPLPDVRDELTGKLVSIRFAIPEELRGRFDRYCFNIMNTYCSDVERVCKEYYGELSCRLTRDRMNRKLREADEMRRALGENELWKTAAQEFGFNWLALPHPASLAA